MKYLIVIYKKDTKHLEIEKQYDIFQEDIFAEIQNLVNEEKKFAIYRMTCVLDLS